jgi:hypothetical protein
MRQEQHQFLVLVGHAPARLTVEQAAWALGCQMHDVQVLMASGLLALAQAHQGGPCSDPALQKEAPDCPASKDCRLVAGSSRCWDFSAEMCDHVR